MRLLALLFGQRIAKTVASMTAAMRQLGDGRFDVAIPGVGRKDELGEMAAAVEKFKLRARERAQAELEAKAGQDLLLPSSVRLISLGSPANSKPP
ncbi:HAMP domain-containing protein [Bradyrhizobium canariense]|uniref:HAMP domain-containing protein n=1 Tax=Bradyrhizobium canariense TaxID=255045 RepID=UPI00137478C7|nr:HAMP domain-containing protein [Bradyrhizobium canariense]